MTHNLSNALGLQPVFVNVFLFLGVVSSGERYRWIQDIDEWKYSNPRPVLALMGATAKGKQGNTNSFFPWNQQPHFISKKECFFQSHNFDLSVLIGETPNSWPFFCPWALLPPQRNLSQWLFSFSFLGGVLLALIYHFKLLYPLALVMVERGNRNGSGRKVISNSFHHQS